MVCGGQTILRPPNRLCLVECVVRRVSELGWTVHRDDTEHGPAAIEDGKVLAFSDPMTILARSCLSVFALMLLDIRRLLDFGWEDRT